MGGYVVAVSPEFTNGPWTREQLIAWEATLKDLIARLEKEVVRGRIDKQLFGAYGGRMTRTRYWALQRAVRAGARKDLRAVKERLHALKG